MTTAPMLVPLTASATTNPPSGFYATHSLLRTGTPGSETRWEMDGIEYVPRICAEYHARELERCIDLTDEENEAIPVGECAGSVLFKPYRVQLLRENSALPSEGTPWLAERLALGLTQMVEETVWTGGTSPGLADGTAITVATADLLLGAAEDKILSAMAGAGTLHMAPSVAAGLEGIYEDPSGNLRTRATGSKIVIGNYPAAKIAAHIGNVEVYVGTSILQDEYFDRAKNKFFTRAYVETMAVWNTCAAWLVSVTP